MMRIFSVIILLFVYSSSLASKIDTTGLWTAVYGLNTALVNKDTVTLKKLIHQKLWYGHSNGWMETKEEMVSDLFSGLLTYKEIDQIVENWYYHKKCAYIRSMADVDMVYDNKPMKMRLIILQVWIKEKKHWKLIARQSAKIN